MTTVWRMLRRRSRSILGSDDTRRYRATDSDAITHDKNTYGVYLQTPEPTLVPLTTVTMERLEFPSSDHGTHSTCSGKAIRTHSTNRWTHIWELNKGIIYQLHICFISVYSISNTLSHTVVTLFDCTHTLTTHPWVTEYISSTRNPHRTVLICRVRQSGEHWEHKNKKEQSENLQNKCTQTTRVLTLPEENDCHDARALWMAARWIYAVLDGC